jgi:hypothetical protein
MNALKLLVRLAKAVTPPIGGRLKRAGAKLIAGGAATGGVSLSLPDVPDSWVQVIRLVLEILTVIQVILGTVMVGAGQVQAEGPVDGE